MLSGSSNDNHVESMIDSVCSEKIGLTYEKMHDLRVYVNNVFSAKYV